MDSRKLKRTTIYWLHRFFTRRVFQLPKQILQLGYIYLILTRSRSRPFRGIELIACLPYQVDSLSEIIAALDLLQRSDPRRFRRVENYIKWVLLGNFKPLGFYSSVGQVCGLRKMSRESSDLFALCGYASVLVHEGTHALLDALRFAPTKATKDRIERLCIREQSRFLARFPAVRANVSRVFDRIAKTKLR